MSGMEREVVLGGNIFRLFSGWSDASPRSLVFQIYAQAADNFPVLQHHHETYFDHEQFLMLPLLLSRVLIAPQAEDKLCKDFLNTIPLISLLGNKAMRPRHWMMLMKATGKSIPARKMSQFSLSTWHAGYHDMSSLRMLRRMCRIGFLKRTPHDHPALLLFSRLSLPRSTGKQFVPPYEDPQLKLGGLLALNLHEFSSDVEEIADQVHCSTPSRFTPRDVAFVAFNYCIPTLFGKANVFLYFRLNPFERHSFTIRSHIHRRSKRRRWRLHCLSSQSDGTTLSGVWIPIRVGMYLC